MNGQGFTKGRAWLLVAAVLTLLVALSGCAGFDEYKCGSRGWAYRDGQCHGMGATGFTWQVVHPDVARELSKGRP